MYGKDEIETWTRLEIEKKIVDIAVGESHHLCLTDEGKLFTFE